MLLSIAIIVVLLVMSALFSGSETALTAYSRPLMHHLDREGNPRAALVNRLTETREQVIGALLLGNNLVNILASALATSVLIALFGEAGVAYATLVMTLVIVVFSEVMPKTFAIRHADKVALAVAPAVRVVVAVLSPGVWMIHGVVRVSLKLMGAEAAAGTDNATAVAELRGAIDLHGTDEAMHERAMLRSVLDLAEVTVGEIMTHRRSVVAIDAGQPPAQLLDQVLSSPYTRLPLWRDKPDNVVGVLHAKALLRAVRAHEGDLENLNVEEVASPPWFIPDTTTLRGQLQAFRDRREHFALVVDEYGTLLGVVTLEDILEEIVGDITDEHDIVVPGVRQQPDGSYLVDGGVTIRDLNRQFEWDLPDEEAATIAGLMLHEARCIPEIGQTFLFHGLRFEVTRRVRNQILTVRVSRPADPAMPGERPAPDA